MSTSFVELLWYLCLVFVMLSRLIIAALWSPAGKGLTSRLLFVMFNWYVHYEQRTIKMRFKC